jgi:hypothetical protein
MAKLRKVVLYIVEVEPMSESDIVAELRNMKYLPNVKIESLETKDIGEWHDGHELNKINADHEKYFK